MQFSDWLSSIFRDVSTCRLIAILFQSYAIYRLLQLQVWRQFICMAAHFQCLLRSIECIYPSTQITWNCWEPDIDMVGRVFCNCHGSPTSNVFSMATRIRMLGCFWPFFFRWIQKPLVTPDAACLPPTRRVFWGVFADEKKPSGPACFFASQR